MLVKCKRLQDHFHARTQCCNRYSLLEYDRAIGKENQEVQAVLWQASRRYDVGWKPFAANCSIRDSLMQQCRQPAGLSVHEQRQHGRLNYCACIAVSVKAMRAPSGKNWVCFHEAMSALSTCHNANSCTLAGTLAACIASATIMVCNNNTP